MSPAHTPQATRKVDACFMQYLEGFSPALIHDDTTSSMVAMNLQEA